ncbi:MAG: biotin/lipoyl-containing protein [Candidatus Bathyarchaeia archaeon]
MSRRRFRVTIGGRTFVVEVEEVGEEEAPTPPVSEAPSVEAKPAVRARVPVAPRIGPVEGVEPPLVEGGVVRTPMPGVIVSINCGVGDRVEAGDPIMVLEAMKMENEIRAPKPGVVKRIQVSERQKVDHGDVLVVIE